MNAERRGRLIPAGYSLLLALLVAGPLLRPGYLLLRDAVSTPRSYLTDSALGLGDAAPRAVPQDALIAALSPVIDGGLLVKTILVAAIWFAGWGAAALAREILGVTLAPQLVAATLAIWNPYVAERLLQGHWSLLTGYAALPWTALLANRLRADPRSAPRTGRPHPASSESRSDEHMRIDPQASQSVGTGKIDPRSSRSGSPTRIHPQPPQSGSPTQIHPRSSQSADEIGVNSPDSQRKWLTWAALAGCLAAAGLTPTGSLLAGCVALLLVGRRNLLGTIALWIAASAPWLAATALSGAGAEPSDPAGVAAFAARAEPCLGTLGSLAGLGGIWNSTAVPDSRTTCYAVIGTALLLSLVATGLRTVLCPRTTASTANTSDVGAAPRTVPPFSSVDAGTARPASSDPHDEPESPDHAGHHLESRSGTASGHDIGRGDEVRDHRLGRGDGGDIVARGDDREPRGEVGGDAGTGDVRSDFGSRTVSSEDSRRVGRVLVGLAVAAVLLPALGATGWGISVGELLVTKVPGAGLLRDTQKYVALAVPAYALCAAAGSRAVAQWVAARRTGSGPDAARVGAVAAVFVVLLSIALPDLGFGVGGAMRAVRYPAGWEHAAAAVDGPGDVAVLPGGMFRKFRYSGSAPVLDPAPRTLPNDVLQTGELPVRGGSVAGEGGRARDVEQLLLRGGSATELGRLGVGWVLVEAGTPGPLGESKNTLEQLKPVYSDRDLRLYRVPGDIADHDASAAARWGSGIAHLVWGALLLSGLAAAFGRAWSRRAAETDVGQAIRPAR
ncbi:hypothetical protein [Nocardia jejuensis]|uniref:hypothetical protein n=1 Tax=Nocardia jejuensis TaxID=328049 RepID=UPI000AC619F3|nr:hypothetical protein [Nocardia jejuensis]